MSKHRFLVYTLYALSIALVSSIFAYIINIDFSRYLSIYYVRSFSRLCISTIVVMFLIDKFNPKIIIKLILYFCFLTTVVALMQLLSAYELIPIYIPSNIFDFQSQSASIYRVRGLSPSLQGSSILSSISAIYSLNMLIYRLPIQILKKLQSKLFFLFTFFSSLVIVFLSSRSVFVFLTIACLSMLINTLARPKKNYKQIRNALFYIITSSFFSFIMLSHLLGGVKVQFILSERYLSSILSIFNITSSSRTEIDGSMAELIFDIWGGLNQFSDTQLLLGSACDRNAICGGSDPLYTSVLLGSGTVGLISIIGVFVLCIYYSIKNNSRLGVLITISAILLSFKTDAILAFYIYPIFIYFIGKLPDLTMISSAKLSGNFVSSTQKKS